MAKDHQYSGIPFAKRGRKSIGDRRLTRIRRDEATRGLDEGRLRPRVPPLDVSRHPVLVVEQSGKTLVMCLRELVEDVLPVLLVMECWRL